MEIVDSETGIRTAILQLKSQQAEESRLLKEQFRLAYDSIKPINFIAGTIKEAAGSQGLRDNIVNTAVGLAAGYLTKIVFVGVSRSPVKKLLGAALMFGATNLVAKNPEAIKSLGLKFLKMIGGRRRAV